MNLHEWVRWSDWKHVNSYPAQPRPQSYKTFYMLNWAWNFNCSLKLNYRQMKKFLALGLSDVCIYHANNVKMPTIFGILTIYIYEQDKFDAQLSWAWKKFYRERGGSVVECLTRDRRAAVRASPASLHCSPWARLIYPSLALVQPRKTRPA